MTSCLPGKIGVGFRCDLKSGGVREAFTENEKRDCCSVLTGSARQWSLHSRLHKTGSHTYLWGSAKRDVTHPTATVVYNTYYHLFRKRSYTAADRDINTPPAVYVCIEA